MLNEGLRVAVARRRDGVRLVLRELLLSGFIIAVGLCAAGAGTHLYQLLLREAASFRYGGKTIFHSIGNVVMCFFCGPYMMLQLGWRQDGSGTLSISSALLAGVVAFGWSFISGLVLLGAYLAVTG